MAGFKPAQIPNDIISLDISGAGAAVRGDCIAVHFQVTGAGNVNFTGTSGSKAAVDVPFGVGTYTKSIRLSHIKPGTTGAATLTPADTVFLEIAGD